MEQIIDKIFSTHLFGIVLSLITFKIGSFIFKKSNLAICNPLLISTLLVMIFLHVFKIPVSKYMIGADLILLFLAPATILLAVPLFQQIDLLKKYWKPVFIGGIVGSITAILSVIILGKILNIDYKLLVSFIPKSITTPIGIEVSKMLGGVPSITVFAIIITGITGSVIAPFIYKIFRVHHPIAKGLGLGIASHAVGTSKAIELGEVEGAMSALSIIIAGIITLIIAPVLKFLLF